MVEMMTALYGLLESESTLLLDNTEGRVEGGGEVAMKVQRESRDDRTNQPTPMYYCIALTVQDRRDR